MSAPRPNEKNRKKRRLMADRRDKPMRFMKREEKVVATSVCVWCGNNQKEYRVICRFCRTCQYCGMRPDNGEECNFCGNHPDKKIRRKRERKRVSVRGSIVKKEVIP